MPRGSWHPPADYVDRSVPRALMDAASDGRSRCIIACLYYAMLRAFEVAALDVADVDLQRRRLTIRHGKGGKFAVLPISNALYREMVGYVPALDPAGPLFPSRSRRRDGERRITRRTVLRTVKACAQRAGIDPGTVWAHLLRHTGVSHLVESGVDIAKVRDLARHSSVSVTDLYTHVDQRRLMDAANALD